MHSGEPARKKVKTRNDTDVDGLQDNAKTLVQPIDLPRDLSFASDTSPSELAQSTTSELVATVKSNSFTVFVLDVENRLFVTDLTDTQRLSDVLQRLASQGCQGAEPGVLIHCRGQTQQDASQTIGQLQITDGCTISLARPDNTARWKASLEMGSLFYELYDAYQAAWKAAQSGPMPESMVQKCRLAAELQHRFLEDGTRSHNCLDKLLGFLETDSIPVLTAMCPNTKTSSTRNPVVDDLHWAACCRLVCVEGYTTTAMYFTSQQEDPTIFPWVFVLLLGLTVGSCKSDPTCHDMMPDQIRSHTRQLQKLGETLDHMCNEWSPWSNLLPDAYFDVSAQQYILMQLVDCITCTSKVLDRGFQKLKLHVTTFTSTSLDPDEASFDLDLTGAWSTMIEVFVALKSKLCIPKPSLPQLIYMLMSYKDAVRSATECCQAVELFAAACIRLGIPQQSQPLDPYTGEPIPDLASNPYLAAVPQPLRQYLAGMLPGIQAMTTAFGEAAIRGFAEQPVSLPSFMTLPILKAVLKVADLKPGGALYRAVTTGPSELQEHFPIELRRQYLHELFPDLSVDANYEEEPDHHQLIVPRDELTQESLAKDSCPVSLTANVTRGLNIMFADEMGQGSGVMKEWLCMVTQHVFGSQGGIFRQCAHDPATVHPITPHAPQDTCPPVQNPMNLAGRLAGLALCYRCPIGIRLSRCFVKMLTRRPPLLSDYAQVDPQVCNGLQVIASATPQQLADMQLTFEPPDGTAFAVPHEAEAALGDPVTVSNRDQYIRCLCGHFFSTSEQVAEFLLGLGAVSEWDVWREGGHTSGRLLDQLLRPLVLDDFSDQLGGDLAPLNVQEWRRYTDARDFYYPQAHQDLDWFWEMIVEMRDEQRRELLCFWTSMSTVPAGGFRELSSKLKLQASSQLVGLPTSHTCFFQLNLPHHTCLEDMTAAFTRALKECKGFGFG